MTDIRRLESDIEKAKDGYSALLANKPVRQSLLDLIAHLDEIEPRMPEYVRERHWRHTGRRYSREAVWKMFREALDRGLVLREGHGQYVKALGPGDSMGACQDRIKLLKDRLRRAKYKPRARRPSKPQQPPSLEPGTVNPFD